MKALLTIRNLLISLLLVGITACGGSDNKTPIDWEPSPTPAPTPEPVPEPEPEPENGNGGGHSVELDFESLHELADFPIGMAVSAGNEGRSIFRAGNQADRSAAERAVIEQHFNELTAGNIMKMSYVHNVWENFTYTQADQLVDYADDHGMGIHGHALVWHACYQIPNWVGRNGPHQLHGGDSEVFLDMLTTHAAAITSYYAGQVKTWDVVNEAFQDNGQYRQGTTNCNTNGEASVFYQYAGGPEYIEAAFIGARAGDPSADLYYNDFNLTPNGPKMQAVLTMVDDFIDRGIPIDGVGFQMHTHLTWPSINDIRNAFQSVVNRGLMVKITELDIPINNRWAANYPTYETFTEAAAVLQRRRYCEIVSAYIDVVPDELRGGITVWGLTDGDSWLIDLYGGDESWPLLFNDDLTPKPALMGFADGLRGRSCN